VLFRVGAKSLHCLLVLCIVKESTMAEVSAADAVPASEKDSPKENEYVKLISKKIRTLAKKLNISIANIEKKLAQNQKINDDEQRVLGLKDGIQKQLKEFEELRNQMLKISKSEEKEKRKAAAQGSSGEVRPLVEFLHAASLVFDERVRPDLIGKKVIGEAEMGAVAQLAHVISVRVPIFTIEAAVGHASKLIARSDEQAVEGKYTYKQIAQYATQILVQPAPSVVVPTAVPVPAPTKEGAAPPKEVAAEVPAEATNHVQTEGQSKVPEQELAEEGQQEEQPAEGENGSTKRDQGKRPFKKRGEGRPRGRARGYYQQEGREGSPREVREGGSPGSRGDGYRGDGYRGDGYRRAGRGRGRGGNRDGQQRDSPGQPNRAPRQSPKQSLPPQ